MAAAHQIVDEEFYDTDLSFVQNVERLCGPDAAASIVNTFGGLRIFVPSAPRPPTASNPGAVILQAISLEHATILGRVAGGQYFNVPMQNAEYEVLRLSLQGVPVQDIARRIRHTERSVYMIRKRLREAGELPPARANGGW